ncbi:MAG: hypothetical protein CL535_16380 [Ahrensia sp.]|nr:hypothetical protein [Ahrensia sp.]MBV48252.1 hypothetical protein [Roseobacter sp.]|tara:strand:- start:124980 stop:125411 length:432 start_codon:yes stop_codon:yes gene_type:complete
MAVRDLMNNIHPVVAIAPVVVTDGTAQVSGAIDTRGYESVTFVILTGTLADADATWAVTVKEGDDSTQGNHTAVADADLLGTEALAGFTFAADDACRKIGYSGTKRYVSIEIDDVTANTGNAPMAVVAILGHPALAPTDNPPA